MANYGAPGPSVVTTLAMDETHLVIGMDDAQIHVFDAATGAIKRHLLGHTLGVWAIALITPDRKQTPSRSSGTASTGPARRSSRSATAGPSGAQQAQRSSAPPLTSRHTDSAGHTPTSRGTLYLSPADMLNHPELLASRYHSQPRAPETLFGQTWANSYIPPQTTQPQPASHVYTSNPFQEATSPIPQPVYPFDYDPASPAIHTQGLRPTLNAGPSWGSIPGVGTSGPSSSSSSSSSSRWRRGSTRYEATKLKQSDVCGNARGWPGLKRTLVVSAGCDKVVRVWDVTTG